MFNTDYTVNGHILNHILIQDRRSIHSFTNMAMLVNE
jgi:hypothetical protein